MSNFKHKSIIATIFIVLISLSGALGAAASDQIGVYWDSGYVENETGTTVPFETVTGYIVIHDPSLGGGILAWECAVDVTGPGVVTSWQLEGQAINLLAPPSFSVGLASPLPPAADTMVASFELNVTEIILVEVLLEPIYFATIPGQMAYIDGLDPGQPRVMTTATGSPVVATVNAFTGTWCGTDWQHVVYFGSVVIGDTATTYIGVSSCGGRRSLNISLTCNDPSLSLPGISGPVIIEDNGFISVEVMFAPTETMTLDCMLDFGDFVFPIYGNGVEPVGIEAPTPTAILQGGQVELEWPVHAAVGDQYHVYRKDPVGHEDRLTDTPLPATSMTVRFSDRPDYPGGTVLRYSYSVIHDGVELSRSPEVEITVQGLPQVSTRLLANVPNPFNPQTTVRFELASDEQVRLTIFDLTGRRVRTLVAGVRGAGENSVVWQGRDDTGRRVSSGAYYVRLETNGRVDSRTIMMLK